MIMRGMAAIAVAAAMASCTPKPEPPPPTPVVQQPTLPPLRSTPRPTPVQQMMLDEPSDNWLYFSNSEEKVYYTNTARWSKVVNGGYVWVLINNTDDQFFSQKRFRSSISRWDFKCKESMTKTTAIVLYRDINGAGQVVDSWGDESSKYSPVIPETVGEFLFNFICNAR